MKSFYLEVKDSEETILPLLSKYVSNLLSEIKRKRYN